MYNKVSLLGNLTRDPEQIQTKTGTSMVSFTVATNEKYTDKQGQKQEHASFINCTAFSGIADVVMKYVKKGDLLFLDGRLRQDTWEKDGEKRSALKVLVDKVQLLPNKRDNAASQTSDTASQVRQSEGTVIDANIDDVPF